MRAVRGSLRPACLEVTHQTAILERPGECGSEEHCVAACPEEAMHMAWVPSEGDCGVGVWRSERVVAEMFQAETVPSSNN